MCHQLMNALTSSYALKIHFWDVLFCGDSLLQCFRVRIRAQIFWQDLGPVRPPPHPHLVAYRLINTNLLTLYVSVFICKNILNSSLSWSKSWETNPPYRIFCFSVSHGFTQHFLFLVFETLFPLMFYNLPTCSDNAESVYLLFKCLLVTSHTSRCWPLLY